MAARGISQEPDEYELTEADMQRFAEEQKRGMTPPQDPALNNAAKAVNADEITSPRIKAVIAQLHDIATGQRRAGSQAEKRRTLVGLAAPQIGQPHRIVLIDTKVDETRKHFGKLESFINPEIIWRTRETVEAREGCFSTGPVWGLVRRPVAVKIRAYDPAGRKVERILEGFSARIACHEIDHLDGVRFPDRITNDKKRHWVHTEELLDYPERLQRWTRLCTIDRWNQFKNAGVLPEK